MGIPGQSGSVPWRLHFLGVAQARGQGSIAGTHFLQTSQVESSGEPLLLVLTFIRVEQMPGSDLFGGNRQFSWIGGA
jgi:hypothetical protein